MIVQVFAIVFAVNAMARTCIKDISGNTYGDVIFHDGYSFGPYYTPNADVVQHLKNLNSLMFTGDEVVVVSYPRSGNHWMYDIVSMLKTNNLEYTSRTIRSYAFDFLSLEKLKQSDFSVYGSHYYPRFLPEDFMKKQNKIIYLYRNPKDVVVSYYTIAKKMDIWKQDRFSMDGFLEVFLDGKVICGKWLDHIREWEKYKQEHPEHPVLMISYEEMKRNLKEGVNKMSNFLELDHPSTFIENVATKCEFENMASYKHSNISDSASSMSRESHRQENILYNKGMVGNWKKALTVRQNGIIDEKLYDAIQGLENHIQFEP